MARSKAGSHDYLPSLLDRIADDSFYNESLRNCRKNIDRLNEKLGKRSEEDDQETREQWRQELNNYRQEAFYLQQTSASLTKIKDCVKRDLSWLFNASSHLLNKEGRLINGSEEDDQPDEDDAKGPAYPEAAKSVINFGIPDLTGRTASGVNTFELEKTIRDIIECFEPRIIRNTLKVKLLLDEDKMNHNALMFEISGDLWSEPVPIHMRLMTELDLENGNVEVNDM